FDPSLLRDASSDADPKIQRKNHINIFPTYNLVYFLYITLYMYLIYICSGYTCALQKDILYQGRMFVSEHWICFHSKVFGKDTKIVIPVVSITNIKKTKTALLLPNALVIATANDRYVFVSFLSRDNTYKYLMSVCLHLEVRDSTTQPGAHRFNSQTQSWFSPGLVLVYSLFSPAFSGEFVEQRREDLEESSSSDSQTPDYDKINVCVLLLSSCYLAFKIVSLEQKLSTLGPMPDFTDPKPCVSLSQVQRNLQRLLDEAS
uniref:GRAM domain-containing protein n=1 Tax=Periophthalmus magnuspinnatus TaxID=409849 RepID=A0A3B3ZGN0_9GOBI